MDYGPFGFVEKYDPLWSPFTSDMERKFGFERQPLASQVNLMTLARALLPLLERESDFDGSMAVLQSIVQDEYPQVLEEVKGESYRAKLGLLKWDTDASDNLWPQLQALLTKSDVDYTMFWRELAHVRCAEAQTAVEAGVAASTATASAEEAQAAALAATDPMLAHLEPCFFNGLPADSGAPTPLLTEWRKWLSSYAQRLASDARPDAERTAEMKATSPKYIPREWILAEAYTKAEKGDFSTLTELNTIFANPFDEHSEEVARKYYRKPPSAMERKAGISYFS